MKRKLHNLSRNPGLWLAILAVTLLLARREWLVAHKPAHPREIADEISDIYQFPFTIFPNHAEDHFVFKGLDETGTGIYLTDARGGKKKLVCHQIETGWTWQAFIMLGWSPDDRYFACAFPPRDPKLPHEEILICDGTSGEILFTLTADWKIAELAWLTTNSFAYSYSDSGSYDVAVIEQKSPTEWVQSKVFKKLNMPAMIGLTATSPHSVAYRQRNQLWSLDFASGVPETIWEGGTNQLNGFDYSPANHEFLLNCANQTGQCLITYYPATKWTGDGGQTADQILFPVQAAWADKGIRHACWDRRDGQNIFYVKADDSTNVTRLPWPGEVNNFVMSGKCLYVSGYLTNGLPGIWRYDFASKDIGCVVPASERRPKYAEVSKPEGQIFTNTSGQVKGLFLWPPVHARSGKKYPAILSQGVFRGNAFAEIAANEGYGYALADRPSWYVGMDDWKRDVLEAYRQLIKNPDVDTNQIYLSGVSAETMQLCEIIKENPDMFKGVLLNSPSALPDLADCHLSSIFIISGTATFDVGAHERLGKYQNEAAQSGIYVKLYFDEGAGHIALRSIGGMRGQLQQYAEFLSEN